MLFRDNNLLTVVYRQHEYNAEVLDGKLTKLEDTAKCTALKHTPDSKWSYTVTPLLEGYIDIVWEEFGSKTGTLPDKPQMFITVVLEEDLTEYISMNSFTLVKVLEQNFKIKKENTIYTTIKPPKKTTFAQEVKTSLARAAEIDYKLTRDLEAATYTFKSPNLR